MARTVRAEGKALIPSNLHGHLVADRLETVLAAVEGLIGDTDGAYVYEARCGDERLVLRSDTVAIETTPLADRSQHVLVGGVSGSIQQAAEFVRRLSASLMAAGIDHSFEVYEP